METMQKFEEYWGSGDQKQNVDEIVFKVITEGSQRTIALETGDVQVLYDVPKADFTRDFYLCQIIYQKHRFLFQWNDQCIVVRHLHIIQIDGKETDGCYALYFNCSDKKPTTDVRIRQAIAYAIDTPAVSGIASSIIDCIFSSR